MTVSNFRCVGAIFSVSEQIQVRWSNFLFHGAISAALEQFLVSVSNFRCVGATFSVSEQLQMCWSNF